VTADRAFAAPDAVVARWIESLQHRHRRDLTPSEFLKAVRALSARYVERRSELGRRAAADSIGKRAAFAAYFAPLRFLTTVPIVAGLGATQLALELIHDLGCGTGAASSAWSLAMGGRVRLAGVDRDPWMVAEAQWTWRQLGLVGRARRDDLVRTAARLLGPAGRATPDAPRSGVVLGWVVNELDEARRADLLEVLRNAARPGPAILILEPIARSASPWWPEWAAALAPLGARADEWRSPAHLPVALRVIDDAAGFRREELTARSLFVPPTV
jgi:hypothetical protein